MPNAFPSPSPADLRWMRLALRLARRGLGRTRPNPPVGAVLVSEENQLLGGGFHRAAGLPHAEIEALRAAGKLDLDVEPSLLDVEPSVGRGSKVANNAAHRATLFVTLEPCSTHGRTPPCTDAILAAGIPRVVVACQDPNPCHAGRGIQILRDAGVRVDLGACEEEARELIAPFAKHILHQLPFVTLKLAMTLDGRIADFNGHSKWITGEKSRAYVQRLRSQSDAILVGANTVIADDPALLPKKHNPKFLRVILDPANRIPPASRVLTDARAGQTLHITKKFPTLRGMLHHLATDHHLTSILCEGGGLLAASLVSENLVDRYELFYAPSLLLNGIPAFHAIPGLALANRQTLTLLQTRRFGNDLLLRFKAQP